MVGFLRDGGLGMGKRMMLVGSLGGVTDLRSGAGAVGLLVLRMSSKRLAAFGGVPGEE